MILELSAKEIAHWHSQWQTVFAARVFTELGRWTADGTDYSVFDHRFMDRFLHGGHAEVEYEAAIASAVVVLFKEGRREIGEYRDLGVTGRKPSVAEMKDLTRIGDILTFSADLSWTAFFHHEDWVPTYFACREWVGDGSGEQ